MSFLSAKMGVIWGQAAILDMGDGKDMDREQGGKLNCLAMLYKSWVNALPIDTVAVKFGCVCDGEDSILASPNPLKKEYRKVV